MFLNRFANVSTLLAISIKCTNAPQFGLIANEEGTIQNHRLYELCPTQLFGLYVYATSIPEMYLVKNENICGANQHAENIY